MTPLDTDNLEQAIRAAKAKARGTKRIYYVIYEPDHTGTYHAVDDFDLDTFYAGCDRIEYCTADN